jgi:DNA polymerase I
MPRLRLLPEVTVVDTDERAAEVLRYLMWRGGMVAIDTETTGLDMFRAQILCWSMATEDQRYFLPAKYLYKFDPLFQRKDIQWALANAKFDMHMLDNKGIQLAGEVHDIIVMDAMDDDTRAHGLKEQARIAYDVRWGDFKELFLDPAYVSVTLGLDKSDFTRFKRMGVGERLEFVWENSPHIVENYASCDAFFTYLRAQDLQTQLTAQQLPMEWFSNFNTLYDYFHVIEVPFTKVLWKMERLGMPIDLDYVKKIDGPMRDAINAQEQVIRKMAGADFNPASADQVRGMLFTKDGFNLKPVAYTKTNQAKTDEDSLVALKTRAAGQKAFDFIEALLLHRTLTKLHGTYVENIAVRLGPDDRIHCKINQTGTRTGRLSASSPNLQQVPSDSNSLGFSLRKMFVALKGCYMLNCDYPQIQPRLAAVYAQEEKMLEGIRQGLDFHCMNASNMYVINDPDAVYDALLKASKAEKAHKDKKLGRELTALEKKLVAYRAGAKTVGLGVLFGEGPRLMAHQLRIDINEAKGLIRKYFETYPNIKNLIDDTYDYAHQNEFASTFLGRIRRFHQINNDYNTGAQMGEERAAFNHLIQGSEIELMKLAMLQLDVDKEWNEMGAQLCMTVHDELIAFAPKEVAPEALKVMKRIMGNPLQWGPISHQLPVSVEPDGHIGENWADTH